MVDGSVKLRGIMEKLNEENKKIVAGIVLYNPELKRLEENIGHIVCQVDGVLLFDNGSANINEIETLIRQMPQGITLIKENANIGIASALNRLCGYAEKQGYQYIITLDHDSVCPRDLIKVLVDDLRPDVAVVGPNIIYRGNESFAVRKSEVESVDWVITSASLTSLAAWREIGGFDETMFIDGVDRDFCIRAKRKGYSILKDYKAELLHELGNLKCRKVFGRTVYVTNHSPLRKYYMVRNAVYLDRKHGEKRRFSVIAKNLIKTLLFENKKIEKFKAMAKGIHEGHEMKISE